MNCTINNTNDIILSVSLNCQSHDVAHLANYHFDNYDDDSTANLTFTDIETITVNGDTVTIDHKGEHSPITLPIISSMKITLNKREYYQSLFAFITQDMETTSIPHKGYIARFSNSLHDVSIPKITQSAFAHDDRMVFLSRFEDKDMWRSSITIIQNTCTRLDKIR